jgi:hypothetical protein
MSSPVPSPSAISQAAAADALCAYFLANADRGDNAANDDLVAELVGRIRAQQQSLDGGPDDVHDAGVGEDGAQGRR